MPAPIPEHTDLIYGFHAIQTRLRQNPAQVLEVYADEARRDDRMRKLLTAFKAYPDIQVLLRKRAVLDQLLGHDGHQGLVARVLPLSQAASWQDVLAELSEPALILVLDGVQDPHNLGACLRVADAMGVHLVLAPKDRAVGLTPVVHKVACGAAETVPYFLVTNLARTLDELKDMGVWVVGTALEDADSLLEFRHTGALAWVLGAEGEGLRKLTRHHCDELRFIPMVGHVESLNVSVAAGMVLFETRRQRSQK